MCLILLPMRAQVLTTTSSLFLPPLVYRRIHRPVRYVDRCQFSLFARVHLVFKSETLTSDSLISLFLFLSFGLGDFQGILAVEPGKATPNSAQIASCSLTYLFGISTFVYTSDVLRLMPLLPFVLSNIMPNTGLQSIVSGLQSIVSGLQSVFTGKSVFLTTRKRAT